MIGNKATLDWSDPNFESAAVALMANGQSIIVSGVGAMAGSVVAVCAVSALALAFAAAWPLCLLQQW